MKIMNRRKDLFGGVKRASQPAAIAAIAGMILIATGLFVARKDFEQPNIKGFYKLASQQNLLAPDLWQDMVGAQPREAGVVIAGVDRTIASLDKKSRSAHQPVNLSGPVFVAGSQQSHLYLMLEELADFKAQVRLYQGVPLVYDEWRYEVPSLGISVSSQDIEIELWDGQSATPQRLAFLARQSTNEKAEIEVVFSNGLASVTIDGEEVATEIGFGMVGQPLWMGAAAPFGSQWRLKELSYRQEDRGALSVYRPDMWHEYGDEEGSLRNGARSLNRSFRVGSAISIEPLVSDDLYRQLASQQFSSITPENAMKAQFLQPQKGVFTFNEADMLVAFAKENQQEVHGHALVFGEANPLWMEQESAQSLKDVMTTHVTQVMTHFGTAVSSWDVINEPLNEEGTGLRRHLWYKAMGEGYIATALRAARQAQPDARLYINDYGLEREGQKWTTLLELIGRLQSEGVPLDGVGFQAHIHEADDAVETAVLRRHFQQLASLGLEARISEVDVEGEDEDFQVEQYRRVIEACLAEPNCRGVTTWGITDAYGSTTEIEKYPLILGNDLLFDDKLRAKKAYGAWYDAIRASR